ncbi:hypothetical protein [Wolbachia endosymbiont of Brugia pahangi]|uniref:hypothetical protein n=1 Tax=Wolbachia endosymbiont of Brugia pahangi TaxID=96495 RepID=UPI00143C2682|nr:hypothetical protein [Wolbachia endosymbiont of Brugia pahangi]
MKVERAIQLKKYIKVLKGLLSLTTSVKARVFSEVEKLHDQKVTENLQDTPKKATIEGKDFEQSRQKETSVQTETQSSVNTGVRTSQKPKSQAVSFSIGKGSTEKKSSNKPKSSEKGIVCLSHKKIKKKKGF